MPYVENQEEKKARDERQKEVEIKENILNTSFNKLTVKQQDALRQVWEALKEWDDELISLDGDCYVSTEKALRKTRWKLYHAFPIVTKRDESDL